MLTTSAATIQHIKDCVIRIRDKECILESNSPIWQGCVNVLSYLLDLSPKHLRNVRLHTEIFSGEFLSGVLFNASAQNPDTYADGLGYTFATESLPEKYWISEPPIDGWLSTNGQYGCNYKGKVINPELCRYQRYFENFISTGMLETIENAATRSVVMEIGTGYGAIGYHLLKMTNKKVCYLVLDLPLMLLYTGSYIATHHPDAKIFIYDPDNGAHKHLDDSIFEYDVVLIPNHQLSILNNISRLDFVINTISMAEMTNDQINAYINFIKPRLVNYFYFQNYNWEESPALHQFVGQHFNARPKLDFYENYIKNSGKEIAGNFLSTFYFTTRTEAHAALANRKFKLFMPDSIQAQLSLSDDSWTVRKSRNNFNPPAIRLKRILNMILNKLPI